MSKDRKGPWDQDSDPHGSGEEQGAGKTPPPAKGRAGGGNRGGDAPRDGAGGEPVAGKPDREPPKNPWAFPPAGSKGAPGGNRPEGGRTPSSIEDLFRGKMGGGAGGAGGGSQPPRGPSDLSKMLPDWAGGRGQGFSWKVAAGAVLALWVATTSIHKIDSNETGVITQLGRYARTVGPGIQMTLPAPFERLQTVKTTDRRTLTIGDKENLIITQDQNIVDIAYSVRWWIKAPQQYLFQLDDPEGTIREVAESAMRAAVASYVMTDAIGPAQNAIAADAQRRMQALLDAYKSGIQIDGVALQRAAAPEAVKDAFNAVSSAVQERQGNINKANAYAQEVTEYALGEAAAFNKVYEQYRLSPEVTRRRMYYETMESVLSKADKTIVPSNGVQSYLPLPEVKRRAEPAPITVQGNSGGQP